MANDEWLVVGSRVLLLNVERMSSSLSDVSTDGIFMRDSVCDKSNASSALCLRPFAAGRLLLFAVGLDAPLRSPMRLSSSELVLQT